MNEKIIENNEKIRYFFLDLLKVLAIIFVVLYHMGIFSKTNIIANYNLENYIGYYLNGFLAMGVPIFFFVNGALLFHKKFDLKKHCIKIIKTIALTIFWSIVSYILIEFLKDGNIHILDAIKSVPKLKLSYNNHIWFLYTLVILYLFFPILKCVWDKDRKIFYFFFIVIFIATIGNRLLVQLYNILAVILGKSIKHITTDMFYRFNPVSGINGYAIAYFMLGAICFEYKEKFDSKKARIIASIVMVISAMFICAYWTIISRYSKEAVDNVWNTYALIFNFINVICTFTICLAYKGNKISNKTITTIGSNTLGIYLLHLFIKNFFTQIVGIKLHTTILTELLWSTIVFIISLLLSILLRKIPVIRRLFSM